MLDYLNWVDHNVFEWIQINLRTQKWDGAFLAIRDKYFWLPLYVFIASWLFVAHRKYFWHWLIILLISITISDQLNSNFIKKQVKRVRPCNEEYFKDHFKVVHSCSGGYSFPSSHATNHMMIGTLMFLILRSSMPRGRWLFLLWALPIGFAQIYVGVHFPFDICAGLIEGLLLGFLIYFLAKKIIPKLV